MKNICALLFISVLLISCGKYEEGPGISLLTKKNRITNVWSLASKMTNGQTTNLSDWTWKLEIKDDETYTLQVTYLGIPFLNESGIWKFSTDKSQLLTTASGSSNTDSWEIIRLTKDELKLKYISGGDTIVDTFTGK